MEFREGGSPLSAQQLNKGKTMRKMTVSLEVKLVINADEAVELSQIIDEMEYSFKDTTGFANIEDETIENYEVIDSK